MALVSPGCSDSDHGGDPIANRLNSLNSLNSWCSPKAALPTILAAPAGARISALRILWQSIDKAREEGLRSLEGSLVGLR